MTKNFFSKLVESFNQKINELDGAGRKWIGFDGLLNMETFALVTIFFMIFLPAVFSVSVTIVIALIKSLCDKKKGHLNEKHDFLCAAIGIIFGCILGLAI